MSEYFVLLKTNIKLLFRNKAYLALIIILPIISVFLLNIQMGTGDNDHYKVYELSNDETNITDFTVGSKMTIKIYDGANNEESKYFIDSLSSSGMYRIFRYSSNSLNEDIVKESAIATANRSSLQAIIYLPEDFITNNSIDLYPIGNDERISILNQHLTQNMQLMKSYSNENGEIDIDLLKEHEISREVIELDISDSQLTAEQQRQQANIAFSLTTVVLGFVFTGVCITSIINYEKDKKVLTRILMVPNVSRKYVLAKATMTLLTVVLQNVVTMIYFMVFVNMDIGLTVFQYIGLLFGLGIIFNLLSVIIGLFIPNTLNTSYIAFFIWVITNMLSGIYFPGIDVPDIWEKISLLMPQKWMLLTSEALISGDSSVVLIYVMVVIAFMIIITTLGIFGIKLNEKN